MEALAQLRAIESIRKSKARYVFGVDNKDRDLYASAFAEDAVLDLRGFAIARRPGSEEWNSIGSDFEIDFLEHLSEMGHWPIVGRREIRTAGQEMDEHVVSSFHALFNAHITFSSDSRADVIWPYVETIHFSETSPITFLNARGYYQEVYRDCDGEWLIESLKLKPMQVSIR